MSIIIKPQGRTDNLSLTQQDLFLDKVKTAIVQAVESGVNNNAKVSAKVKPKGIELTIQTSKVRKPSKETPDYFNTISFDDYSNTMSEKEFKSLVVESAQTVTKDLMKFFMDSDRVVK